MSVEKITSAHVKVKFVLMGAVIWFLEIFLCTFFSNFETYVVQIYITVDFSGVPLCIVMKIQFTSHVLTLELKNATPVTKVAQINTTKITQVITHQQQSNRQKLLFTTLI